MRARTLLLGLLWAIGMAATAAADDRDRASDRPAERRSGGDLFVAGGGVTVGEPVAGDLFVAGGGVDVDAAVAGDVVAMGGKLRLGAEIGQSLYAAGGRLSVAAKVVRNARVAGGQVEFGPKSEVGGNLSVAGGQVRVQGPVRGHVQVAGGLVLIDAAVGGDVLATSEQVELGPNARIAGKLVYHSGDPLRRDPAAQVAGGVEELQARWPGGEAKAPHRPAERESEGTSWLWTAGLVVLAGAMVALLPGYFSGVARQMRERPGSSLLAGFVVLACVPIGVLVLMITLVGIPLALAVLALYLALLPAGYTAAAIGLGDWALARWRSQSAGAWLWRVGAAALVLVMLALLVRVPFAGGFVVFAALLAGLGAMGLQAWRWRPGA